MKIELTGWTIEYLYAILSKMSKAGVSKRVIFEAMRKAALYLSGRRESRCRGKEWSEYERRRERWDGCLSLCKLSTILWQVF